MLDQSKTDCLNFSKLLFPSGCMQTDNTLFKLKLIFTPDQGIDRYGINMITDASMESSKYGQGSAGLLESYQLSKGKNLP